MEKSISSVLQWLITRSCLLFSFIPPDLTDIMLYVPSIFKYQIGKEVFLQWGSNQDFRIQSSESIIHYVIEIWMQFQIVLYK